MSNDDAKNYYLKMGKYVVGRHALWRQWDCRQIIVEKFSSTRHFVDITLCRQALCRHSTSSTQHFVDITLRRQAFRRQAFRRHGTSSTYHFVDTAFYQKSHIKNSSYQDLFVWNLLKNPYIFWNKSRTIFRVRAKAPVRVRPETQVRVRAMGEHTSEGARKSWYS